MSNEDMNIMEEDSMKSKVYVKLDNQNRVIQCEGGYTIDNIKNIGEWTLIDEGEGDRFNLCQSNYFDGGLYTQLDRIEAQVTYTAMMTDTMMEG